MMADIQKCLPSFLCYDKEKGLRKMEGKGGKNTSHGKEE